MTPKKQLQDSHQLGHRERLRERCSKSGIDSLAFYEMIELMLFLALPRRDVKFLAKQLASRFKDFPSLLNASPTDLKSIAGIGDNVVFTFRLFRDIGVKQLQHSLMNKPILTCWQHVIDYCIAIMAYEIREQVRIFFLNIKNQLICDEVQQTGTINHTPLYPREVVKRALDVGATALIVVHNHPSGDPAPSQADIVMTRQLDVASRSVGLHLHDHLIIGKGTHVSLKTLGLF